MNTPPQLIEQTCTHERIDDVGFGAAWSFCKHCNKEWTEKMNQSNVPREQEPVAYYHPHKGFYFAKPTSVSAPTIVDFEPLALYTTPLQRTWVGLTEEEIDSYFEDQGWSPSKDYYPVIKDIEAKLKEKNT